MKGFTLIEMIISVGIFSLVTALVVWDYGKFNGGLIVTNLAYQVALTVRQAQVYGLSVRGVNSTTNGVTTQNFNSGYGVHFEKADTKSFYFFADVDTTNSLGRYTYTGYGSGSIPACATSAATEDQCLEKITLQNGNVIEKFCAVSQSSSEECEVNGNPTPDKLDIVFKRPDPDASVIETDASGVTTNTKKVAKIYIKSAQGKEKLIIVDQSGQISIK